MNIIKDPPLPILTITTNVLKEALKGNILPDLKDHFIYLDGDCNGRVEIAKLNIVGEELDLEYLYNIVFVDVHFIACFSHTIFRYCYFIGVTFNHCTLYKTTFLSCVIDGVDYSSSSWLRSCIFVGNDIKIAVFPRNYHIPMVCPETGSFTGWKKGRGGEIIQLEIPADANRSSANGRKCRCSKAKVVSIVDKNGCQIEEAVSNMDTDFIYKVGKTVYPDQWDPNRWDECSQGIHFFMTREEAVEYEWGIYPVKPWDF